MSLHLQVAVTDGLKRAATKTGVVLAGLLFVLQLTTLTSVNTVLVALAPPEAVGEIGLTLPVSATAGAAILLVGYLLTAGYFVVLARALSRPLSELSTLPRELYTRRIGWATLSTLIAGLLSFIAITIGFVFLILPGLFLALSFMFFVFAIGVEDRGVIGSLSRSWELSRGNRLKLGLVVLLLAAVGVLIGVVGLVFDLLGLPAVGDIASAVTNSVVLLVSYAIIAAAYLQLVDHEEAIA